MNIKMHISRLVLPSLVVLAFGTATFAEKKEVRVANGLTAGQFIRNCESQGGEIDDSTQGEGVSCTLSNGTNIDCSFGPKDTYCEVTTPRSSVPTRTIKGLLGDSTVQVTK